MFQLYLADGSRTNNRHARVCSAPSLVLDVLGYRDITQRDPSKNVQT